ncbi:MAG: pentapeptide repeat protein [Solimicrobium sp.]|jgi:hypothetical protein|nr:pentapeptide repeat protein [Solimicrobium sp.]
MNLNITPRLKQRPSSGRRGSGNGGDNKDVLENIFFTQSKQQNFLDLLATHRARNSIGQFHGIDLSHVDLSNVDLTGVDLTGANLTNANLTGAKLISANLSNARLIRTVLCNANLTDAILTNVIIDRATRIALQQSSNQHWFDRVHETIDDFNQKWEKLKEVDGFNAFETMLKRLNDWDLKDSIPMSDIIEVISSVINSPAICRLVFSAARGTIFSCQAYLLTLFNNIQGLTRFSKLLSDNAPQGVLLALAKGMVRQNLLGEATLPVMRNQWSERRREGNGEGTGPNVIDALSVQLALRHQLAEKLNLPFTISNPLDAADIAKLNNSDKEFAIDFVNKHLSDRMNVIAMLIAMPVWQFYLEHTSGKKIAQREGNTLSQTDIDTLLRQETEKIMSAAGE